MQPSDCGCSGQPTGLTPSQPGTASCAGSARHPCLPIQTGQQPQTPHKRSLAKPSRPGERRPSLQLPKGIGACLAGIKPAPFLALVCSLRHLAGTAPCGSGWAPLSSAERMHLTPGRSRAGVCSCGSQTAADHALLSAFQSCLVHLADTDKIAWKSTLQCFISRSASYADTNASLYMCAWTLTPCPKPGKIGCNSTFRNCKTTQHNIAAHQITEDVKASQQLGL